MPAKKNVFFLNKEKCEKQNLTVTISILSAFDDKNITPDKS